MLPLCLLTLASALRAGVPVDASGTLLGGWASGLTPLLPLSCALLLLLAGWLRLGPARLLATLLLGFLALRLLWLAWYLPVGGEGATLALVALCSLLGLWLLPAPRLPPGAPAWGAAGVLLAVGALAALLLWPRSEPQPPCSFDQNGRQLSLCLGVAVR